MNRHKINQELENRTEERDGKWVKIPISCLSYRRIRTGMWSVGEWNPVRTLSLHLFRSYFLSVDSPVNLSLNHLSGLTRLSSLVHRLNPNPEPSPSFPRLNPPPLRYATFILGLSPTALMSDRRERVDDRRDKEGRDDQRWVRHEWTDGRNDRTWVTTMTRKEMKEA